MKIRKLQLRDILNFGSVYTSLSERDRRFFHPFPFQPWGLIPVLTLFPISAFLRILIREMIPQVILLSLVAYDEATGSLAGFGYLRLIKRISNHQFLAGLGIMVNSAYRGKGLGTVLMNGLIKLALQNHIGKIFLVVLADNTVAIDLYKKCGFNIVANISESWRGRDYPAFRMELRLIDYNSIE